MKLIDVDEIPKGMLKEICEELPRVEAIPVKWIIEWSSNHMEYGTLTIEKMLEDWNAEKARKDS